MNMQKHSTKIFFIRICTAHLINHETFVHEEICTEITTGNGPKNFANVSKRRLERITKLAFLADLWLTV